MRKIFLSSLKALLASHLNDVRLVYRHLPLSGEAEDLLYNRRYLSSKG